MVPWDVVGVNIVGAVVVVDGDEFDAGVVEGEDVREAVLGPVPRELGSGGGQGPAHPFQVLAKWMMGG